MAPGTGPDDAEGVNVHPTGEDTIFALSSGTPPAGIAVVRISGPRAGEALRSLAGRLPPARHASLRGLRAADGTLLDRALVLWLPGPGTATGEDMTELHLHGGRAVVAAVQDSLRAMAGLRVANAGEFTRRALFNGRIDLAEAEGLADLLEAQTERQRRQALRLTEGGLTRLVDGWRADLLMLSAEVEAAIEFGEEEDVLVETLDRQRLGTLLRDMEAALAHPPAERLRDGVRVLLAGPVNSGKSSLFNALAGRDAAIVSSEEGTTRDLVEAPIVVDGVPLLLIDSAGLRDAGGLVEAEGIARTQQAIERADLLVWLGEPGTCPCPERAMIVHSRCDLTGREAPSREAEVAVSSATGAGILALRRLILERAKRLLPPEDQLALLARHRRLLERVAAALRGGITACDLIIQAEYLRDATALLDEMIGGGGVEAMLDVLFGRFCIGK